jgi:hypothetical protein
MTTIITSITKNRAWTDDERNTIIAANDAAVAAGTTNGSSADSTAINILPQTTVRIWTTTDAANAYVAMINGFTPPVPEAIVHTF